VILGATVCGLASPFLAPAMISADAVRKVIRRLRREFATTMFLLGASSVHDLFGHEEFILTSPWNA
jgi:isopentenyl-diphosphate delta-isomerase